MEAKDTTAGESVKILLDSFLEDLKGRGVSIIYQDPIGNGRLIGALLDFDAAYLYIKSRGNENLISRNHIIRIKPYSNRVRVEG